MSTMTPFQASADPVQRLADFLKAWREAPHGCEVIAHPGILDGGRPVLVITIGGEPHGFTFDEAEAAARALEENLPSYPGDPEEDGVSHLIYILREGAKMARTGLN